MNEMNEESMMLKHAWYAFFLLVFVFLPGCLLPTSYLLLPEDNASRSGSSFNKTKAFYGEDAYVFYRVKPGDSLFSIGQKLDISVQELIFLNQLSTPHMIFPGQHLVIRKNNKETGKHYRGVISSSKKPIYRSKSYIKNQNNKKLIQYKTQQNIPFKLL